MNPRVGAWVVQDGCGGSRGGRGILRTLTYSSRSHAYSNVINPCKHWRYQFRLKKRRVCTHFCTHFRPWSPAANISNFGADVPPSYRGRWPLYI